jgi:hypothetical protein
MNVAIANGVNSLAAAARSWRDLGTLLGRDPLILDLDGGGIRTSAINPKSVILFDHDGDGLKTASGWVASGEAFVVRCQRPSQRYGQQGQPWRGQSPKFERQLHHCRRKHRFGRGDIAGQGKFAF